MTVSKAADAESLLDTYCQFVHIKGKCDSQSPAQNCSCDPTTGVYTVDIHVTGVEKEVWEVAGDLTGNYWGFKKFVYIHIEGKLYSSFAFPERGL